MDNYEKWGYSLLAIIVIIYMVAMFVGMIATFPYGIVGLLFVTAVGILLVKVLKERIRNKEDDYYNREVDK
jgi:hypothetical protein